MSEINVHMKDCQCLIGKDYKAVHVWLDACSEEYPVEIYGVFHRTIRHNVAGIHTMLKKYGVYGGLAAIIHILRDRDGICPNNIDLQNVFSCGLSKIDWMNL